MKAGGNMVICIICAFVSLFNEMNPLGAASFCTIFNYSSFLFVVR